MLTVSSPQSLRAHGQPRAMFSRGRRVLVAFAAILLGSSAASAQWPPAQDRTVPVVPQQQTGNQNNLDHSQQTIENQGCLLTAMTMYVNSQLAAQDIRDADGNLIQYTPDQINALASAQSTTTFRVATTDPNHNQGLPVGTYRTDAFGNIYRDGEAAPAFMPNPDPNGSPRNVPFDAATATGSVSPSGILSRVTQDTRTRTPSGQGLVSANPNPINIGANGANLGNLDDAANRAIAQRIYDELAAGRPVPVWTNGDNGVPGHWVLITSWHAAGGFDITDPVVNPDTGERREWLTDPPYNNWIFRALDGRTFSRGSITAPSTLNSEWRLADSDLNDPLLNPGGNLPYIWYGPISRDVPSPTSAIVLAGAGVVLLQMRRRPN